MSNSYFISKYEKIKKEIKDKENYVFFFFRTIIFNTRFFCIEYLSQLNTFSPKNLITVMMGKNNYKYIRNNKKKIAALQ